METAFQEDHLKALWQRCSAQAPVWRHQVVQEVAVERLEAQFLLAFLADQASMASCQAAVVEARHTFLAALAAPVEAVEASLPEALAACQAEFQAWSPALSPCLLVPCHNHLVPGR